MRPDGTAEMRNMEMESKKAMWTLALGIALLPPLWAVLAPYIGVTTGGVALICAGLFVANGNQYKNALKIFLGFLCGDIWAVSALRCMGRLPLSADLALFATLFLFGALAVILGTAFAKFIFLPSWLCGWAIGMTVLGPLGSGNFGSIPIQIAVSMFVGVFYVGIGVDLFQKSLLRLLEKPQMFRK